MALILDPRGKPMARSESIDVKIPLVVVRDKERLGNHRYRCRVCAMRGEETVFYEGEEVAFARHLTLCSNRHEAELRGRSLRVLNPTMFDPNEFGDPEKGAWMRKHAEAILEGRKKL